MPKERHQNGCVEEVGKRVKKWKGHYYTYDADGKRHHRSADLGKKAGKKKWQAEAELQRIIERETGKSAPAGVDATFEWFWDNRFVPFQAWGEQTKQLNTTIFKRHVLPKIGSIKLTDLDKHHLQVLMQSLSPFSGRWYTKFACT